jgi:hypothetical protein
VTRYLFIIVLAAAACGEAGPPTGFGVDLTISLTPAARARVQAVKIQVSGAETFDVPALPISVFPGGTARIRYVPGVQSGTLRFAATGLGSGTAGVAYGASEPVALVKGKAVFASIIVDTASPADMALSDSSTADMLSGDASPGVAVLSANQATYDFGTVPVNTPSPAAILTVTNTGASVTSPLQPATLTGPSASVYKIQSDNCAQRTLAPNASCTVSVVLESTVVGTPAATLNVSATLGGTAMITVSGTVVRPGAINLSVTPSTSPVAILPKGIVTLTVTITNNGGAATGAITWGFSGDASGDYTVATGTCSQAQILAVSASCVLTVQFAPRIPGPRNATLTVAATPGGPGVLELTGTALTPAAVSFTQATYSAPTPVRVGSNAIIALTLENSGTAPSASLPSTIQTTGNTDFVYETGGTCVLGSPLAGSSSCTIYVKFQPSSYGAKSDSLAINVGGTISASLSGTGEQTFILAVINAGATGTDEITSSPASVACGTSLSNCTVSYTVTTTAPSVSLAPTVDAHSRFVGFSGDCSGPTCSLSITKDTRVIATWQATFVASVTVVGNGTVSSTSSPAFNCTSGTCSLTFDTGTTIGLSANASAPDLFSGWNGACSGSAACNLTSAAPSVTATFACPSVGSTAYVDHTNGVDDTSHGGAAGNCAFKTLAYALANTSGNISLLSTDTFPGGVAGEPNSYTLNGTQGLTCNGATFKYQGTLNELIVLNGTANRLYLCTLDGSSRAGNLGLKIANSGSGPGHSIIGNYIHDWNFGVSLLSGVVGVNIQSNNFLSNLIGVHFTGSNGATLINNNLDDPSTGVDVSCDGFGGPDPNVTGSGNYHDTSDFSITCSGCQNCSSF